MKIQIVGAKRTIARYQLNPITRALKELKSLGYEFVNADNNPDYIMVQVTALGKDSGLTPERLMTETTAPIIVLDDSASTGTHKFSLLRLYPDRFIGYIKKQLLRDRSLYKWEYPRNRYHYYQLQKIQDSDYPDSVNRHPYVNDEVLSKVHLGWSLALMERSGIQTSIEPNLDIEHRDIDIHFSVKAKHITKIEIENLGKMDNMFNFHRSGCTVKLNKIVEKHGFSVSGKCKGQEYLNRMGRSKVCISPYGLGECCFRDLEAYCSGAICIKPSMDHIETWPNLYRDRETYISCKPDWSDLESILFDVVNNYDGYKHIARNTYQGVCEVWDNELFANKFDSIMKSVLSKG